MKHPYFGQTVVFSTSHRKEVILEAEFEKALKIKFEVPKLIDTDQFGTFTGEVQRPSDLKKVLKEKAILGLKNTDLKFCVSSEGSFGPDPLNPYLFCNQENLLWVDLKNNLDIFASTRSYETSYAFAILKNRQDFEDFLDKNPIEQQPIVLKDSKDSKDLNLTFKGLSARSEANEIFEYLLSLNSSVWIESDLRAHKNKKRQKVIYDCGQKLLQKILSLCPKCSLPGFSISRGYGQLECMDCGLKSDYPSHDVWTCIDKKCNFENIKHRSDGLLKIEPKYCHYCNP